MITLYSTHCPKCEVLKKKLENKNIKFTEVNDVDVMLDKNFLSAPMLEVDDEVMDFAKGINWINKI